MSIETDEQVEDFCTSSRAWATSAKRKVMDCLLYAVDATTPTIVPVPVDVGFEADPKAIDLHPYQLLHRDRASAFNVTLSTCSTEVSALGALILPYYRYRVFFTGKSEHFWPPTNNLVSKLASESNDIFISGNLLVCKIDASNDSVVPVTERDVEAINIIVLWAVWEDRLLRRRELYEW
ncbi:hypothetical protein BKA70DRAFT_1562741 [Coprinopsis sp. MPI-PUGE-AT-0042]|nr:hypothetical protein BKA70DRAFT_1562741 [Coprinopsis sp. MPI-PUGE-AT-0042]